MLRMLMLTFFVLFGMESGVDAGQIESGSLFACDTPDQVQQLLDFINAGIPNEDAFYAVNQTAGMDVCASVHVQYVRFEDLKDVAFIRDRATITKIIVYRMYDENDYLLPFTIAEVQYTVLKSDTL